MPGFLHQSAQNVLWESRQAPVFSLFSLALAVEAMEEETDRMTLDELFREVVSQMAVGLGRFAQAVRSGAPSPDSCEEAHGIAHSLHGSGKLYGYPCVSELGAALEKLVNAVRQGYADPTAALASLFDACSAALLALCEEDASNEDARSRVRDLTWESECVLHASPARPGASGSPASTSSV